MFTLKELKRWRFFFNIIFTQLTKYEVCVCDLLQIIRRLHETQLLK